MKTFNNIAELIGKTPVLKLNKLKDKLNLKANLFVKLESFNPAGSAKDRIALYMLKDAKEKGLINSETVIIEPTSGNTGIGLAALCSYFGYKLILTMPETMSVERRNLISAYGAEIVLTEGKMGMKGAIAKANELAETYKNSFIPSQFTNLSNPKAHFETTGPEIWEDMDGNIDYFVAGVGTGGTISGVGKYLKSKNPKINITAVEPSTSPVLSKGVSGAHKIQGIGAGFIPETLDTKIYDDIMPIDNEVAFEYANKLAKTEGILVGISSGAALAAGVEIAKKDENKDKNIVVFLPDGGEKYLSTGVFS
ncbi:MAG: cysteine synthase A [Candidatus Gastranaerophilales bacterium]|nr:cysteine synthase A [Candidatus Gastranaerophilales bacterium]